MTPSGANSSRSRTNKMSVIRINPNVYDVWSALPTYFQEASPFYVEGQIDEATAWIEILGYGIVAEVEVMLVEKTQRPFDRYWRTEATPEVTAYSLVDVIGLDFHHPLLGTGLYEGDTDVEIRDKWERGYRVPSAKWTRETFRAHLADEQARLQLAPTTVCEACGDDLSRFGAFGVRLMEYHLEAGSGTWLCPTCHKARHYDM
ncbi:hypothetical protein [Exiguobacterium sp. IPCI3]|uniref:hypothetical protein n=2 Tax=Exiguobacterium TaxID=33986 RepID=UPI001F621280|nr:hypothetical protein [Exiguobacterium sp. IPCI3]